MKFINNKFIMLYCELILNFQTISRNKKLNDEKRALFNFMNSKITHLSILVL